MEVPVLRDFQIAQYFKELAADSLYPSAGSSAAVTTAHAAALFALVCRVNLRKIQEDTRQGKKECNLWQFWNETLRRTDLLMERSLALAQEDGYAIKDVLERNPQAPEIATAIPLDIARCAGEVISLIKSAFSESYAPVRADAECARCLAEGSKKAALMVARYNLPLLKESERQNYVNQITELEAKS